MLSNFVYCHLAYADVILYESEKDGRIRTTIFGFYGSPSGPVYRALELRLGCPFESTKTDRWTDLTEN